MALYIKYLAIATGTGLITWQICNVISVDLVLVKLMSNAVICIIVPNMVYFLFFRKNKYFVSIFSIIKDKFIKED